jgi:hypothetical protein
MSIQVLHWLTVGNISEAATHRIETLGGRILSVAAVPQVLYVVGIPCTLLSENGRETDVQIHTWTRSQEAIIEVPSFALKLSWISVATHIPPTDASANDTSLDLYEEAIA